MTSQLEDLILTYRWQQCCTWAKAIKIIRIDLKTFEKQGPPEPGEEKQP